MSNYDEFTPVLLQTQYEIPPAINLYQIFVDNGLQKEIKHIAKYSYFLHLIYRYQKHTGNWVKISTKIIRRVISYNPVLMRIKKNLFDLGIIDIDKHYIPKSESRKYKICDQYMDKNLTSYLDISPIPNNPPMKLAFSESDQSVDYMADKMDDAEFMNKQIKRLDKIKCNVEKASKSRFNDLLNNPALPQYRYILNNISRTTVDEAVFNHIQQMANNGKKLLPKRIEKIINGKRIPVWQTERKMTEKLAHDWINLINMVKFQLGVPSCPTNTDRLYTSITSFPSEVRKFLRVGNKRLYYIDIRNSQPFFFLYFVLRDCDGEITDDVEKYIDWVCSGNFYDNLMLEMGLVDLVLDDTSGLDEKQLWEYEAKRTIFKIDFFGKVFFSTEKKKSEQRVVFDKLFPTVSAVITKMKKFSYKELSLELQRLEASMILGKVFYRLATILPNSYATPVHDAIICEEDIKDSVIYFLNEEIKLVIGFEPKLKIKELF